MGIKFDEIYESVVSVLNYGGFAPGYIVKFRANYKSNDAYKAFPTYLQEEIDELVNSGLHIKVVQVGHNSPGDAAGNQFKTADNVIVTVAADQGGGRHYNSVTVPAAMLDVENKDAFTAKIPDQFVRKDPTDLKPKPFKADSSHPTRQTNKNSGIGGKNTPTDLKLAGESTRFSQDRDNMALLYENIYAEPDFEQIYKNTVIEEGFIRRLGAKLSGGFKSNPLQKTNQTHVVAKSLAYDAGKDIAKMFGGDISTHTKEIYKLILDYINSHT